MKAKTFIQNLSKCIFEEYKEEIPKEELKSSFVEAIKNVSAGKLQDDLNENFDKNLKRLEKSLKNLCTRELPSISSHVDDSLEELTKSELDSRTEVTEEDGTSKHVQKVVFSLLDNDLKKPKPSEVKKLNKTKRCLLYRTFLQKLLNRKDASHKFIQTVIQDFDNLCEISEQVDDGKSKFDWLPMCNLLLELVTGSKPLAYITVLKILFDAIGNDVNKCLAKSKPVRSGKLAGILKKFITCCHLHVDKQMLKESERMMYCRYVSAILSFYVDLCCIYSSKVEQKNLYGREIAGYVCYILQPWPECLLEVALQLQGLEEDSNVSVLLPLISKCLEVKPSSMDHVYYLKYVLLVRQVKDAYGEYEQIQQWNYSTKNIAANTGFLDWMKDDFPEALEHIPVEDKKFKKTKITRFLLEEAEDDLIALLLNSLCKEDNDKKIDVEEKKEDGEASVSMETGPLFYLDKTGGSSTVELADEQETEVSVKETFKGIQKERHHRPILLKTISDVEMIVDSEVKEDGTNSPQTYTLDPKFILEKVVDPDDQEFLQSEIISITSVTTENDTSIEAEKMTVKENESLVSNSSDKSGKWGESSSSTPNKKRKRNRKNKKTKESDYSDISAIEKSEDFCDSVSSMSEDNHKMKSVVRKVAPKSPGNEFNSSAKSKEIVICSEDESGVTTTQVDVLKDNSEICDDTYTGNDDENVTLDDAPLSSVHESSAEIVDIVLEPDDRTDSLVQGSVSDEQTGKRKSDNNQNSATKGVSPRKLLNDRSQSKQFSNTSLGKTENSGLSESSLSCWSGLSTATNYSETIEINTTGVSESDNNSTLEVSQLDNTAKFIGGKSHGSPVKSPSGSESDSVREKLRKGSKKSGLGGKEVKSPSNGTSEMHEGNESDEDVFRETNDTKKETKTAKSIEEKFIVKAIKGKKTPKKSTRQSEINSMQGISGSVTLFVEDDNENECKHKENDDSGKRTKSTEEIIQIVEDIKGKINTPRTRKSKSKGGENPNESMFTDDSVESLEKESNISTEMQESAEKKGKLKSDSCDKSSPKKMKSDEISDHDKRNMANSEQCNDIESVIRSNSKSIKAQSKVEISKKIEDEVLLIESSDVSDIEQSADEKKVGKSDKSPHKSESLSKSPGKHVSSTPSPTKKSPSKIKNKRTPHKSDSEDSNVRNVGDSVKSDLETSMKSSSSVSEGMRTNISVIETPDKKVLSPNISLTSSANKRKNSSDESKTILAANESKEIVSNSEDESETIIFTPKEKESQEKSAEMTVESPSSAKKNGKTPQSGKKGIKTPQSGEKGIKTPQSDRNNVKTPLSEKKDIKTPQSDKKGIKTPKSDEKDITTPEPEKKYIKTPQSDRNNIKTPLSEKKGIKTPQSEKKGIETPPSEKKGMQTPQSDNKVNKTPHSEKKGFKTPQSDKKDVKTPQSDKKNVQTPKSDKVDVKSPNSEVKNVVTPQSEKKKHTDVKNVRSPVSDKKKTTPQKIKPVLCTHSSSVGQVNEEKSIDSADEFVPSSQKKLRSKSEINEANKKELKILSSSIESDEDIDFLPDIGSHLKVSSPSSKALDSKSPNIPTNIGTKASQKKKVNETTPLKRRQSSGVKGLSEKKAESETDHSTKKRVTRARRVSEPILDSEKESVADGPTRPKRLRTAAKAESESADSSATKDRGTKGKAELKRIYDYHSGTDGTTDQSDNETRPGRRLRGGVRLSAIKDKIPEAVDEEHVSKLRTPLGKSQRQRTGSASTTKKAVMKHAEVRGTRKRRLSGELAGQGNGGNSTDSEVSFPKTKQVTAVDKKTKRLSTPVIPASAESKTDTTARRYSLRKK